MQHATGQKIQGTSEGEDSSKMKVDYIIGVNFSWNFSKLKEKTYKTGPAMPWS